MTEAHDNSRSSTSDLARWIIVWALIAAIVVGNSYYSDAAFLYRLIAVIVFSIFGAVIGLSTHRGRQFRDLVAEARTEMRRVVWPTRVETGQTSVIVLVCVVIVALFLWMMDLGFGATISFLIG
jgi:preprotein translocase subunit SecE